MNEFQHVLQDETQTLFTWNLDFQSCLSLSPMSNMNIDYSDIDYTVVSSRERINPYHTTRDSKCYEIQHRHRHFSIVISLQVTMTCSECNVKKCRTMRSIFIIRAGCSSRKKKDTWSERIMLETSLSGSSATMDLRCSSGPLWSS